MAQVRLERDGFVADQLWDKLSSTSRPAFSRPTFYRTLSELVEAGLLRKEERDGLTRYKRA